MSSNRRVADYLSDISELYSESSKLFPDKADAHSRISDTYADAATKIQGLNKRVSKLSYEDLIEIRGIGKGIAGVIVDYLNDEESPKISKLRDEVEAGREKRPKKRVKESVNEGLALFLEKEGETKKTAKGQGFYTRAAASVRAYPQYIDSAEFLEENKVPNIAEGLIKVIRQGFFSDSVPTAPKEVAIKGNSKKKSDVVYFLDTIIDGYHSTDNLQGGSPFVKARNHIRDNIKRNTLTVSDVKGATKDSLVATAIKKYINDEDQSGEIISVINTYLSFADDSQTNFMKGMVPTRDKIIDGLGEHLKNQLSPPVSKWERIPYFSDRVREKLETLGDVIDSRTVASLKIPSYARHIVYWSPHLFQKIDKAIVSEIQAAAGNEADVTIEDSIIIGVTLPLTEIDKFFENIDLNIRARLIDDDERIVLIYQSSPNSIAHLVEIHGE